MLGVGALKKVREDLSRLQHCPRAIRSEREIGWKPHSNGRRGIEQLARKEKRSAGCLCSQDNWTMDNGNKLFFAPHSLVTSEDAT